MLAALAALGHANDVPHWPNHTVRIIVGYPAGSAPDSVARLVADRLRQTLDQPVVVENRPGASGNLGVNAVVRSTDGHTFGFTTFGPLTTSKLLVKGLPYDPSRDVQPISLSVSSPLVLVCDAALPPASLEAFIVWARTHRGGLTYGSAGIGTGSHLTMELMATRARFAVVHVPYAGVAEVTTAIVSHQVEAAFIPPSGAIALAAAGKLRMLAVSSAQRWPLMPELPAMAEETEVGDFRGDVWIAAFGPIAMPADAAARLGSEINTILQRADIREQLRQQGWQVVAGGPDQLRRRMADDTVSWGRVIHDAKVPAR